MRRRHSDRSDGENPGLRSNRIAEFHEITPELQRRMQSHFFERRNFNAFTDSGRTPVLLREVRDLQSDLRIFKLEDSSRSFFQRFFKRWIDVAGALTGLVILSPLMMTIYVIIRLTSEGPAIFTQYRIGKGGKFFKILKFRTMVNNAEDLKRNLAAQNQMGGPAFKMKEDPRVTPIGRFLRRYSLDELPQLFNVLKGDMSLVGPRPAIPDEVYSWKLWQTRRLSVDQGLTCIWQISGRSDIKFDHWMVMDLDYIDNWSLRLDVKIILKTVLVVLRGKGAY